MCVKKSSLTDEWLTDIFNGTICSVIGTVVFRENRVSKDPALFCVLDMAIRLLFSSQEYGVCSCRGQRFELRIMKSYRPDLAYMRMPP